MSEKSLLVESDTARVQPAKQKKQPRADRGVTYIGELLTSEVAVGGGLLYMYKDACTGREVQSTHSEANLPRDFVYAGASLLYDACRHLRCSPFVCYHKKAIAPAGMLLGEKLPHFRCKHA